MPIFKVEDHYYDIPMYMVYDVRVLYTIYKADEAYKKYKAYRSESEKEIINTNLDIAAMDKIIENYNKNKHIYRDMTSSYH